MNLNPHARIAPLNGEPSGSFSSHEQLAADARRAIASTRGWLLDEQHADGHWVAELEGDTILESETSCCWRFSASTTSDAARKAARYILVDSSSPRAAGPCIPAGRSRSAAA